MDPVLEQVGARLRAARHRAGLTLGELAARTGVSASTVSRLESGKRQASLELLLPLTRQLGVTLDDLVAADAPDPRIRQTTVRRHGLLIVPLTAQHAPVRTYKITYPATTTATLPAERVHYGYEWLYVLHGRLRLRVGGRELVLSRGEAAEFDTRTPHTMAAAGGRPAEVLSIFNEDGARIHTLAVGDGPAAGGSR